MFFYPPGEVRISIERSHGQTRRALRSALSPVAEPVARVRSIPALLRNSTLGRQSLWYFLSQLTNGAIGVAVLSVLTRSLSVSDFGLYSLVLAVLVFLGMFTEAGITTSGARLMAIAADDAERRSRAAALMTASLFAGVALAAFTALASLPADRLFGAGSGALLLLVAPFALLLPVQEMVIYMGQGANRIGLISIFFIMPRVILLPVLLIMYYSGTISVESALVATCSSTALAVAFTAFFFKPRFSGLIRQLSRLLTELKEFGRDVYVARIVDGLATGLDKMLLSFYHGLAPVGYYTLALTMASPIGMLSKGMSTSGYRGFAHVPSIPRKLLLANLFWCAIGTVALVAACELLIPLLFTDKYSPSLGVLPLLAAGVGLMGLNAPYHSFLAAQRQGRTLRRLSVITSGTLVALNLALIPYFGMIGAGAALVATFLLNLVLNLRAYGKFRRAAAEKAV